MRDDPVQYEFDTESGIAVLRFNRPHVLNAIDVPLAKAFHAAVRQIAQRNDVRCIIITGAGNAFVAGGDIAAFGNDPERSGEIVGELLASLNPALLALQSGNAPIVAAVRGVAAGGGLSLVLAADLVIAEEGARFVLAYDKIASSPDFGGTWFLPRKVGRARAAELMLLGEPLTAEAAQQVGIVNRVVARGAFDATVRDITKKVAAGPTQAFGAFRRLLDGALDRPLAAQLDLERDAFIAGTETEDFREGVAAFLGKRRPSFTGR